jgi:hypothetical protein
MLEVKRCEAVQPLRSVFIRLPGNVFRMCGAAPTGLGIPRTQATAFCSLHPPILPSPLHRIQVLVFVIISIISVTILFILQSYVLFSSSMIPISI